MYKYILIFTVLFAITILSQTSHSIDEIPFFHEEGINRVDVSSDGKRMVTCGYYVDNPNSNGPETVTFVRVWDIEKSILLHEFVYENSFGSYAAFSPDDELLFICVRNDLFVYDLTTYKIIKEIEVITYNKNVNMQFSSNKKTMILSSSYYINVIDLDSFTVLSKIEPIEDITILNEYYYDSVNVDFDKQIINYIYYDYNNIGPKDTFLRIEWDIESDLYSKYYNYEFNIGSYIYPFLSTDNKRMFTVDERGVFVYDSVSGKLLHTLSSNFDSSFTLIKPDSPEYAYFIKTFPQFPDYIWVGYNNGTLKVWDIEKAECVVTLYMYHDPISDFDISLPDNCVYVAGGTQIQKFNLNFGQDIYLLSPEFFINHLYDIENSPVLINSVFLDESRNITLNPQRDAGNSFLMGKDDEIVITGHDLDGVSLFWYHNDIKEKILSLKWGLYIQSIVPSGNNSFNILVHSFNDQSWKIYKITGPFQPVSDWTLHK